MALKARLSLAARDDLREIKVYFDTVNPTAFRHLMRRIADRIRSASEQPFIGQAVQPPLPPNLRKLIAAPYVIFYRPTARDIGAEIVAKS